LILDAYKSRSSTAVKKTVAIVEDDPWLRNELVSVLKSAPDIECLYALTSGEEALLRVPRQLPDVVLMDIKLPGLSGIDCVGILKKNHPILEIVMLTVYQDAENIFQALKAGASGYLIKSSDPEALYSAIRDVSAGGAPFTSHIARQVVRHFQAKRPATADQSLSPRELEVLKLMAAGYRYREIAGNLGIALETVKSHVKHICEKMHVRNRIEAIVKHCS
jgi:DNA-binding NarL/FixJ family response regulator